MSGTVGDLGSVFDESVCTLGMTPGATPKVSVMYQVVLLYNHFKFLQNDNEATNLSTSVVGV
jgi:hypothetical protein